jgi:hypothetical protein
MLIKSMVADAGASFDPLATLVTVNDPMPVHVDPSLPVHPLSVADVDLLAAETVLRDGLDLVIQMPLNVGSRFSQPEPDLAITPVAGRDVHPSAALLVIEVARSSRRLDLGRKAEIYAEGGVPEYWVLDGERRELVIHRNPADGAYASVHTLGPDDTVTATAVDLTVPLTTLL